MEGLIDTSVLVDYIVLEAELHGEAVSCIGRLDRCFVATVVIEELVHVLDRLRLDRKLINDKLHEVLSSCEVLSFGTKTLLMAAETLMKAKGMTFRQYNDMILLSIAKDQRMLLLTFDKDLMEACRANGVKLLQDA